jgi:hypothetical protein
VRRSSGHRHRQLRGLDAGVLEVRRARGLSALTAARTDRRDGSRHETRKSPTCQRMAHGPSTRLGESAAVSQRACS